MARQQASRREFVQTWDSLKRAIELGFAVEADATRVDVGFAWLQDGRLGAGQRFSIITDPVTLALNRALLRAEGTHAT
jgi:hypothetical protein